MSLIRYETIYVIGKAKKSFIYYRANGGGAAEAERRNKEENNHGDLTAYEQACSNGKAKSVVTKVTEVE